MAEPPSDIFAGNPYLRSGEQLTSDQLKQVRLATIGQMLTGLGVGIAQAGPAGQPWYAGIAPGAAAASHAIHETQQDFARQQAVAEELRQREMERQSREAYQGLQTEVIRRNLAFQDMAMKRLGMIQAPQGAPGMNVRAPAVQMGPQGFANNFGNIRESNADFGGKGASYNGFETFDSPQSGASAMVSNLAAYAKDNPNITVAQAIAKWAPPNENNTAAYVAKVAQGGIDPNTPLASVLKNPIDAVPLLQSMTLQEKGALPPDAPQLFGGAAVGAPSAPMQPVGPTTAQATMPSSASVALSPAALNPFGAGPSLQPTTPGGTGKFPHPGAAPTAENTGLAPVIAYGGPILSKDAELKLQDLQKQHAYAMEQYEQQSATPSPIGEATAKITSTKRAETEAQDIARTNVLFGGNGWESRSPEDMRKTANPELLSVVESVQAGRTPLSAVNQSRTGSGISFGKNEVTALGEKLYGDNWDPNGGDRRQKFEADTTDTSSQTGKTLYSINTVYKHLNRFQELTDAIESKNTPVINHLIKLYNDAAGYDKYTGAESLQHALGTEIANVIKGQQLNEPEVLTAVETLNTTKSQPQMYAALGVLRHAMGDRESTIKYAAARAKVPESRINGLIDPDARAAILNFDKKQSEFAKRQQSAGPSAAPAVRKYSPQKGIIE